MKEENEIKKEEERWKTPRDWAKTETYYFQTLKEQFYGPGRNDGDPAITSAKLLIPNDVKTVLDIGSGSEGAGFNEHVDLGLGTDFHWLPYGDNSFDLVWARHALEHSPMPFFALLEWHRVTKKYLLIILPEPTPYIAEYWGHWSCLPDFGWRALFKKANLKLLKDERGEWIHYHPFTRESEKMMEMRFLLQK